MKKYSSLVVLICAFSGLALAQSNSSSNSNNAQVSGLLPANQEAESEKALSEDYFNSNLLDTLHYRVSQGKLNAEIRLGTYILRAFRLA